MLVLSMGRRREGARRTQPLPTQAASSSPMGELVPISSTPSLARSPRIRNPFAVVGRICLMSNKEPSAGRRGIRTGLDGEGRCGDANPGVG